MDNMRDFTPMEQRFRGFLPVVVDLETGGFNHQTDALLQIAAIPLLRDEKGHLHQGEMTTHHIVPFEGANMEPDSLAICGIDPYHPLRLAIDEKDALGNVFKHIRNSVKQNNCSRAILVGHNAHFDLNFLNAAVERCGVKRNPFHLFSVMDTVTLAGMAYGQTVLARAIDAAHIEWDDNEAHSAIYDAEKTAELFCKILNRWNDLNSFAPATNKD